MRYIPQTCYTVIAALLCDLVYQLAAYDVRNVAITSNLEYTTAQWWCYQFCLLMHGQVTLEAPGGLT